MRYKTYIDYTGTGYVEFFPNSVGPFGITRELPNGNAIMQFFDRMAWGKVEISNKPYKFAETGLEIYRLFDHINTLDFNVKILIKHVTPKMTIYGYFGRNDCEFDEGRKKLIVTPAIIDKYTPIFENWEKEVDFTKFTYDGVRVSATIPNNTLKTIQDWPINEVNVGTMIPDIVNEYPRNRVKENDYQDAGGLGAYFDGEKPKDTLFEDSYWGFQPNQHVYDNQDPNFENIPLAPFWLKDRIDVLGQSVSDNPDDANYGPKLDMHYGDYEFSRMRIYEGTRVGGLSGHRWRQLYCETEFTREEIQLIDTIDTSNKYGFKSPIGDGWNMRKEITMTGGKSAHIWTRKPFDGAYSENWELSGEVAYDGSINTGFTYYKYRETKLKYADTSETIFELKNTITLRNFVNYIINSSDPELADYTLKSTFFFNDFENEVALLDGTDGFNYVTGLKNHLNNLRLYFTRYLLTLDKNEVKDIPKYSLKSILDEFHTAFANNLIWFVDANGYLRLEHIAFIDLVKNSTIDIRSNPSLFDTSKWSFDKSQMFERYEYKQENAGYVDFTDNYISFDKIVSNNRNKDDKFESKTQLITTDLKYCISNPSNLADGFIMIAVDSENAIINKVGRISGEIELNGAMALSSILYDFATYEGVDVIGVLNGKTQYFKMVVRNKLGIELKLKGTVESLFYLTQLGCGLIDSGEIDFEREYTKIKLRYRYNSSTDSEFFALLFQKETDFIGAVNTWANIGNYTKI